MNENKSNRNTLAWAMLPLLACGTVYAIFWALDGGTGSALRPTTWKDASKPDPAPRLRPGRHGYHIMLIHDPDLEREDGVVMGEDPPGVWTVEFRHRSKDRHEEIVRRVFERIHEAGGKPMP